MSVLDAAGRLVIRQGLFRLDPERAHNLALRGLGLVARLPGRSAGPGGFQDERLAQTLLGIDFPNPIGLAAGLDKQAVAVPAWARLGFGFCEVGTITAQPQPGNPRPRVFRLPDDRALINRFGFNSEGSLHVAARLADWDVRGQLHAIPLGINIGKSKVAQDAEADYLATFGRVAPFADYVAVNVSSPNTPGLRDLQERDALAGLLARLTGANHVLERPRPILVKVAPDLDDAALDAIVDLAVEHVQGIIVCNTTIARDGLTSPRHVDEVGGLSGAPVRERSDDMIARVHRRAPDLPIIGVGGVFGAADAWAKIRAGARLVQVYTGFVYEGPGLVRRINEDLVTLMEQAGVRRLVEAVGGG